MTCNLFTGALDSIFMFLFSLFLWFVCGVGPNQSVFFFLMSELVKNNLQKQESADNFSFH